MNATISTQGHKLRKIPASISELQDPTRTPVGTCDLFEVRDIGESTVSVFSGFGYRAYTTVVLRGGDGELFDFSMQAT
jgi:hypothetical protein